MHLPPQAERPLPTITVAVLAFDGISPFHLSVPCLVFGEDRRELGVLPFRLLVCAAEPQALHTQAGFDIIPQHGLASLAEADIVIVPTWRDPDEAAPTAVLAALRAAHARGATVVGLCLGAFVLADAGLLDGRTATTHWYLADCFARRFPKVRLDPDVLYVDEGEILTSAGTAASLDCCLYLLRRLCGAEVANRVARRLVIAPHRQGGQAQFIEQPLPASRQDDRLAEVLIWVQNHLPEPHSVESLAARAAMSRRTFTRRFKQATGTTLLPWLLHQRLSHAQRLLEQSRHGMEQIAAASGFGSAVSLRQHFGAAFGIAPASYRRQFQLQQG
ncbi:GlxA family transcriptional regulator [Chitinimonas sp.]|uniref:GlxA family transcriptional regulator n=1 Tax=Chitinimonas sp. TaxID=1934313 RepID=UPI002F94A009